MLFIILVVLVTALTGGAAYESHRFVQGAWNYVIMVLVYALISFSEWVTPDPQP